MQVRARGASGGADIADDIALGDAGAVFDSLGETLEVSVGGFVSAAVPDANVVSVAAVSAGAFHGAVAGGVDGRAGGRGEVQSAVHAVVSEDRVETHAESRAETGAVYGGAHESFAHGVAVVVVVFEAFVGGDGVSPCGEFFAAQDEFAVEEVAGADLVSEFVVPGFKEEGEAVAGLDVALEVHGETEDLNRAREDGQRHSRVDGGEVEAGLDFAFGPVRLDGEGFVNARALVRAVGEAADFYAPAAFGFKAQTFERGGVAGDGREDDGLSGAKFARIEDIGEGGDDFLALFGIDAGVAEQTREGVAAIEGESDFAFLFPCFHEGEGFGFQVSVRGRPDGDGELSFGFGGGGGDGGSGCVLGCPEVCVFLPCESGEEEDGDD